MITKYNITGISCSGCVANIKKALESVPGVTKAEVQKETPNATVTMEQQIELSVLQQAVKQYGNYRMSE